MDIYPFGGCDLMVGTTVPSHVDVSVLRYIVYKPGYFVGVCLYYNLIVRFGIDNSCNRSVDIDHMLIYVRLYVIEPYSLAGRFKASRRCVVEVLVKKLFALLIHV